MKMKVLTKKNLLLTLESDRRCCFEQKQIKWFITFWKLGDDFVAKKKNCDAPEIFNDFCDQWPDHKIAH